MYGDTVLNYKLPARPAWFINVLMMMMLAAVNNQVVINVQLLFFYRDVYIEKRSFGSKASVLIQGVKQRCGNE